jgi:hypothetical protein
MIITENELNTLVDNAYNALLMGNPAVDWKQTLRAFYTHCKAAEENNRGNEEFKETVEALGLYKRLKYQKNIKVSQGQMDRYQKFFQKLQVKENAKKRSS